MLTRIHLPDDKPIMGQEPVDGVTHEHPLVAFSVYTDIQVKTVRRLAEDILHILDTAVSEGSVDATGLEHSYGLFWLWVLAAYEITRTMTQVKGCFSKGLSTKLTAFKINISPLRIIFAKQEYPGKRFPIASEASIYGLDTVGKDMRFEVRGAILSARTLIAEFDALFKSITPSDILHDYRWSYNK